jgi:tRNA-specific 2-thiouridylase
MVGLSGGVDSSVAALRLQRAGYEVIGVFIKVWHPDFLVCNWEAERLDAMRVAAHLGIPFLTCDAEAAYRDAVAGYFINAYREGLTPNPDVMCNQHVKFGAFLDFAHAHGVSYVATGHYAQVRQEENAWRLYRGIDTDKDQSYFLWTLSQQQLAATLLPVGDSTKETIRREAALAHIPTATKKDSQGICFLGHVDISSFLRHYLPLTPGPVLDEAGNQIGEHQGAFVYTLGQRHGFSITKKGTQEGPHFVVQKDTTQNTITVAPRPPTHSAQEVITLRHTNWIPQVSRSFPCSAQFRYRQSPFPVTVTTTGDTTATIVTHEAVAAAAQGQSCVLYDGERCLGGGIIG